MLGEAVGVEAIAAALEISEPTLRKHFADELSDPLAAGGHLFDQVDLPPPAPAAPLADGRGRGGGRPALRKKLGDDERVMEMVATGMSHEAMAVSVGLKLPAFRRLFRQQLSVGRDVKRAEVVKSLFEAGRKGSVPALSKLLDMIERAQLADLDGKLTGAGEKSSAPVSKPVAAEALGKKLTADLEAKDAVANGPWSDVLNLEEPAVKH